MIVFCKGKLYLGHGPRLARMLQPRLQWLPLSLTRSDSLSFISSSISTHIICNFSKHNHLPYQSRLIGPDFLHKSILTKNLLTIEKQNNAVHFSHHYVSEFPVFYKRISISKRFSAPRLSRFSVNLYFYLLLLWQLYLGGKIIDAWIAINSKITINQLKSLKSYFIGNWFLQFSSFRELKNLIQIVIFLPKYN